MNNIPSDPSHHEIICSLRTASLPDRSIFGRCLYLSIATCRFAAPHSPSGMLPPIALVFYPFTASAARFMGAVADNSTILIDKVALAEVIPSQYAADIPLLSLNPASTGSLGPTDGKCSRSTTCHAKTSCPLLMMLSFHSLPRSWALCVLPDMIFFPLAHLALL